MMIVRLIPLDSRHDSYGPFKLERFTVTRTQFIGHEPTGGVIWVNFAVDATYSVQAEEVQSWETAPGL